MKIKFLHKNAVLPTKAHPSDAGYDLTITEIKRKGLFKIHYKFGFAVHFEPEQYARIYPRSSVQKRFLWLSNSVGIIDNGYTGEWQAVFYKIPFISKPYKIGERCCQAIFEQMNFVDFKIAKGLGRTDRGAGGYGSTGL